MTVHTIDFDISENGEQDSFLYEQRRQFLIRLLKDLLVNNQHGFFHDTTVTSEEFAACISHCSQCKHEKPIIFSSIVSDSHLTLKSQLHSCFKSKNVNHNDNLSNELMSLSPHGYVVYNLDELYACCSFMLETHDSIRLKMSNGSNGIGQRVLDRKEMIYEEISKWQDVSVCIEKFGVVVEENLTQGDVFSYTNFILPQGEFCSMGKIIEKENSVGENVYQGTTCIVFKHDTFQVLQSWNLDDIVFGEIQMHKEDMKQVMRLGTMAARIYQDKLSTSVLQRVNFDIFHEKKTDRWLILDTSLRPGGNTWCEISGAKDILQAGSSHVLRSVRVIDEENLSRYLNNTNDLIRIAEYTEDNVYIVGFEHQSVSY